MHPLSVFALIDALSSLSQNSSSEAFRMTFRSSIDVLFSVTIPAIFRSIICAGLGAVTVASVVV
jgi:hypothetical protein